MKIKHKWERFVHKQPCLQGEEAGAAAWLLTKTEPSQ